MDRVKQRPVWRKSQHLLLTQRTLQDLSQVDGLPPRRLLDLLAATEAIGDDQSFRICLTYCRQEHPFSNGLRHRIFFLLKAKRSRHSTATRVQRLQVRAHLAQQLLFVRHLHDCFVMAMSMKEQLL